MPGFPVLHHLLEFAQTHVHCVGDAIQPSHPLSPSSPPVLHLSSIRVFSNDLALCIRWPSSGASVLASVLPINFYGRFPLRATGLISWQSKGLSRVFSNTTIQISFFFSCSFMVQLSHPYITTRKTIALT